jgi:hypothetical protein
MNQLKRYTGIISRDLFQVLLLTYLFLLLLEAVKSNFVSYFFNLNIMLLLVLLSGLLASLTYTSEKLNTIHIGNMVWHYFFTTMKGRWGKDSKWQFLFKEVRAKELIKNNLQYTYNDWRALSKEIADRRVLFEDPAQLLREISFRRMFDRDWKYFSSQIKNKTHISENDFYFILITSLVGGLLLYFKTKELGSLSLLIAVVTFVVIFIFSIIVIKEEN